MYACYFASVVYILNRTTFSTVYVIFYFLFDFVFFTVYAHVISGNKDIAGLVFCFAVVKGKIVAPGIFEQYLVVAVALLAIAAYCNTKQDDDE